MVSPRTAFASLLILAAVATAACGVANASSSHDNSQPVIDQTSSARSAGPDNNQTAQATVEGAFKDDQADAYPRVLWMYVDDSDPALSIVHIGTNVPTTASLYPASIPGHPLHRGPAEDLVFATEHTIALVPGPNGAFNLQVTDAAQDAAYAQLRTRNIVPDAYFVDDGGAPQLSLTDGLHGLATWETQLMSVPRPQMAGTALVFADPFACKQDCAATHPVSTGGDQPVSIDQYTDRHTVGFVFPDRTHDYAVVVGGVSAGQHGSSEFYQFEVSGSNLPQ